MICGGYGGGACVLKRMVNIVQCGVFSVLFHLLAIWEGQWSPSLT